MTGDIPTRDDWADRTFQCDEVDRMECDYAFKHYFGKTIEEIIPAFLNAPCSVAEEIESMPPVPFRYYVQSYARLLSRDGLLQIPERSFHDVSSIASIFLGMIARKLDRCPIIILPIMDELMPLAEYVAANQELYDADREIFGSFAEGLHEIKSRYAEVTESDVNARSMPGAFRRTLIATSWGAQGTSCTFCSKHPSVGTKLASRDWVSVCEVCLQAVENMHDSADLSAPDTVSWCPFCRSTVRGSKLDGSSYALCAKCAAKCRSLLSDSSL